MRYVLDFGAANAGGAPAWTLYKRLDTLADLAQPTITEIGSGQYYFEVDWALVTATSITFKAALAGIELSDVISAPGLATSGTSEASAAVSSLSGYTTVGPLVGRAAVQCGILSLTRAQIATYDPFASTEPGIVQMLELFDQLGMELAAQVKTHLQREFTITTAGGATSYALPADYVEMTPNTQWNRSSVFPMVGPLTSQEEQFLKAWNGLATTWIPYRVKGNRITFVTDPGNGILLAGLYISRYWIQTAASGTGPDADHITAASDYVLFDPTLIVLGLKWKYLQAKSLQNAPIALAEFEQRLEWAKSAVGSSRVLSLNGGNTGFRFINYQNYPTRLG